MTELDEFNLETLRTGKGRSLAANNFNLRLEGVIDLASSVESDQFYRPDGLHEDLIDDLAQGIKVFHQASMKPLFEAFDSVDVDELEDDELAFIFHRNGLDGYVAKFTVPVYTHATQDSATYSWGYTNSTWFYGQSLEELWMMAIEWSIKRRAAAVAQYAKS